LANAYATNGKTLDGIGADILSGCFRFRGRT
jgi:hypothetical protein